jgi:class 3 adenylate cyclase
MEKYPKIRICNSFIADFEGFTHYSERLSPEKLVESVDYYFSKFDEIMAKYDLEKIKTVGDCYMCAGGLPFATNDHALNDSCRF